MLGRRIATAAAIAVGGYLLSKQLTRSRGSDMTSTVEESIEVDVPISTAYNQWTQFEDLPQFMDSVHEVRQLDDKRLHWKASIAGKEKEWDAEITEQIPEERIAWRSLGGVHNAGVVTFHKISENKTRVMLQMDYDPESIDEKVGDALGFVKMQTKANLKRYKQLVESRGVETGAWRGTIPRQ
ncbi:SRPBCC family protein [Noviherbaspirillum aridicola]|uniref:Cyclase n=1 Tax=Noviherbaspirillum aridicola TaxID=2849687 RepID=A0ABQ4Q7E4_9BURK|nr:SRPBCC family protein [Noviherbaspirillum aridicola]GIZ52730.1 cyclase [Noviherbaspirillum aridicola]